MIDEMITSGVIRNSTSPYSSPIVMVKKKDGSWRISTWSDHLLHLEEAFKILRSNVLFVNKSKCDFGVLKIDYLGHVISEGVVAMDQHKLDVVSQWPEPKTLKGLRGFLGLTGYYRRFIQGYGVIARPLHDLLKKGSFHWNQEATIAFEKLKKALTSAPVLTLPDFSKEFTVETDASG
ncbi:uncharacterized mitochondrial protein AtMg00860-like [Lycium ferocissimum]|uniref:uncharacterized mitochondrial protein AtMg00860-like n=1 Tax=Lycium ferocissimum TaxID=112874 RepID=UPI0028165DDE|nr:uncharacterized mitochondrial protein AtMg00860-like [Lycium ferocissimum]